MTYQLEMYEIREKDLLENCWIDDMAFNGTKQFLTRPCLV